MGKVSSNYAAKKELPIERSGCCTDPHPDEPAIQAKKTVSEQDYASVNLERESKYG